MTNHRQLTISVDVLPRSEGVRAAMSALYLVLPEADMRDIIRRFHQCQGLHCSLRLYCSIKALSELYSNHLPDSSRC